MIVLHEPPPLFDEIVGRFKLQLGAEIIFAWGQVIYNPTNVDIPPQLIAHEEKHGQRQHGNPEGWWRRYLVDDMFRLEEEVHAHIAEYQHLIGPDSIRNQRRSALKETAKRLAAPLYDFGPLVTRKTATELLKSAMGEGPVMAEGHA